MAFGLHEIGPVEAVGEPGRYLPPLGAARSYYAEDEWRAGVRRRISSAELVVLSIGRTPAVGWEVGQIKELHALDKTVFVVPPVDAQDRRARLHILAGLLDFDPRFLDYEQSGLEVLAIVAPNGQHPAVITSGVRDDVSYDMAVREAVAVLLGRVRVGAPIAAPERAGVPVLPQPLVYEPRTRPSRRPWYRRPLRVALVGVIAVWALSSALVDREKIDPFDSIVDLETSARFLLPVAGSDVVVAVQNRDEGVAISEVDVVSARARPLASMEASPTGGAASKDWVVLTNPGEDTVSGVSRETGSTWTVDLPGAPQGVAVGPRTALVALPERDTLAELRLRDGRIVQRVSIAGRPYSVSEWPGSPLVALAGQDRVVRLTPDLRSTGASFPVSSPRRAFETAGGPWSISAATGSLARLEASRAAQNVVTSYEFLPRFALSRERLALGQDQRETIAVVDARTEKVVRSYKLPYEAQALALTDSGKLVMSFSGIRDLGIYDIP